MEIAKVKCILKLLTSKYSRPAYCFVLYLLTATHSNTVGTGDTTKTLQWDKLQGEGSWASTG